MRRWNLTTRLSPVVVLSMMTCVAAASGQVVVPNDLSDAEGNFDNTIPWSDEAPVRYQQVYLGSEVGPLVDLGEIRFREDDFFGVPFAAVIPDVTVVLSSTTAAPDGLSLVFSENLGPDAMVVYSGPLPMSSSSTGDSPNDFDIAVRLQQTFDFDPSGGLNLLMDVTIPAGPELTSFDAELSDGDSVSRVYCWVFADCLTTDDAMIADSVGLVTLFMEVLFMDGFESGDTSAWTVTSP